MKLTKKVIDNLSSSSSNNVDNYAWDDEVPGFGVRIYPSGKKSFIIHYRFQGRKRFMVLGQYGVYTLEQARQEARLKLVEVQRGSDPLQNKQNEERVETVEELCKRYLDKYAKLHKKTWEEDERRINKYVIPKFDNRKVNSITRNEIETLHQKIGEDAPYEANRILALLSKIFDMAVQWEILPESHPNPARKIKKFKEEKRDRWVTSEELPNLAEQINLVKNIYIRSALWLYLLTGMRKNELLTLKWEDVDMQQRQIRLGQTKSGRTHYVPISSAAKEIIEALPKKEGNPYLFPGRRGVTPLLHINKSWAEIRKAAKLNDVRLHDLRRTVGSWLATQGHSLLLIGKVLNHADPQTTAIYAHLTKDPIKDALENHGKALMEAAKGKKNENTDNSEMAE